MAFGARMVSGKVAVGKLSGLSASQVATPDAASIERAAEGFKKLAAGARVGRTLPVRV